MEKESTKINNSNNINNNNGNHHYNNHHHHHHRERHGLGIGSNGGDATVGLTSNSRFQLPETRSAATTSSSPSDFVLQWGNRKRLRCMKIHVKDESAPVHSINKTTVRVDRRVVRSTDKDTTNINNTNGGGGGGNGGGNGGGYFNLRHRPISPPLPPPVPQPQRVLRNSEAMRGQSNGDHKAQDKKGNNNYHHHNNKNSNGAAVAVVTAATGGGGVSGASSDTAHDSKKGGSSSGSDAIPVVWPPKFMIALTTKEKEEDFMAIKGSKLPQRPKKRTKLVQRSLNLVSPGAWLCDLTLDRYEVREKKVSKKRPRGLKAMGNMESDSE